MRGLPALRAALARGRSAAGPSLGLAAPAGAGGAAPAAPPAAPSAAPRRWASSSSSGSSSSSEPTLSDAEFVGAYTPITKRLWAERLQWRTNAARVRRGAPGRTSGERGAADRAAAR
jgi:hypothetical protein